MTQRPPRSIRLSAEDEALSQKAAQEMGLTWHGWVLQLIRKALLKKRTSFPRPPTRRRRVR
jgi:hypothetical protein